jgi:hypothetical protein
MTEREFAAFLRELEQDYKEDCRRTGTTPVNDEMHVEKGGFAE